MVKEIKCYQDSKGKIHQSSCEAHRSELLIWLMRDGVITEGSAKALADRMVEESSELKKMIEAVNLHCPGVLAAMEN